MRDLEDKMRQAGVRISAVRLLVYREIWRSNHPLTALEVESALQSVDRSSITRSLSLFHQHGLLHTVDDGNGATRYEVCRHFCEPDSPVESGNHNDLHVHFHCKVCGRTECLLEQPVPKVEIPEGYVAEMLNYVIRGICAKCARKE